MFLIYPKVSQQVLEMYICRNVEGVWYMVTDFNLLCYDKKWNSYLPANIIAIILYPVGIPLLFFILLLWNRPNFYKSTTRVQFGFLYDGYAKDTWWFELVDMCHKLFLTAVLAFIPTASQSWAGMIVAMFYAMVILLRKPYYRKGDDRLHLYAQMEIFLLLMAGNTFAYSGQPDYALEIIISIFLIALVIGFIGLFIAQAANIVNKIFKFAWAIRKADFEKRQASEDKEWFAKQQDLDKANMLALSGEMMMELQQERMDAPDDGEDVPPPPQIPKLPKKGSKAKNRLSDAPPPPPSEEPNYPSVGVSAGSGSFGADQGRVMRLSTAAYAESVPEAQPVVSNVAIPSPSVGEVIPEETPGEVAGESGDVPRMAVPGSSEPPRFS